MRPETAAGAEPPGSGGLDPSEPVPPPPRGWPEGFGASTAERDALLVLAHVELLPRDLHGLAWREGSAAGVLRGVRGGEHGAARAERAHREPGDVRAALERSGARQLTAADPGFPEPLLDLPDPPAWLFVRGELPTASRWVAMVGARRCSGYGREVATAIGRQLAAAGVVVVSGAASGIDAAAHRGALEGEGATVAVLGCGIDVVYPKSHRSLIARIADEGAVVSEYPPGASAMKHRFPARNRIVAALGAATVVVEGAQGSGSRITAEFAVELGRDVFGVPGPVTSPLSAGPHELIRAGAGLARGARDVLDALELGAASPRAVAELTEPQRAALGAVVGPAVTLEEVAAHGGLDASDALAALTALEILGLVRSAGGRYQRTLEAMSMA